MTDPTGQEASGGPGATGDRSTPGRSARRQFAATILTLEAFVVLFATLVAHGLRTAPPSVVWAVGGSLAGSLILVAGMLRWPGGYVAGSVLQLAILATGLAVPMMLVVGTIFAILWIVAMRLGSRIDRERRERELAAAPPEGAGPAAQ